MHYLIAAGTSTYSAGELPYLAHALDDVERVAEFLTSPEMGYTRVLGEVSLDPVSADFEDALSDWCTSGELTADDVVVVYYAGHGEQPNPGAPYRLACADSRFSRPRSWLSPQNMAEILAASPLRNVLFVIDSCHAAHGSTEIQVMTDGIVASRPRGDDNGAGTWVLASARHRDLADDGAFVSRFVEVCAAGDGPSQRYLSPSAVAAKVNQAFLTAGARQRAACSSNHQGAPPPFFPNPGYDPSAEVGDREVAGESSDLSSHFEPRGRGVEHVHDPGSYFTGRRTALDRLRDAMTGPGGRGALAVTAAPGSGNSAVLGRLVLEGHSDVSVNARNQSLEALVARLAATADPWKIDTESAEASTTGFANTAGDAVLFIAITEEASRRDSSVIDRGIADGMDDAGTRTRIHFWNATTRQPIDDKSFTLPTMPALLAPHHNATGTRYIAIVSADSDAVVLDLENNRFQTVYPAQPENGVPELRNLTTGYGYYLRWGDAKSGSPVLVYMSERGRDDTSLSPVVVWDSAHPEAPARELPVRARRLLWTGLAPSGESLLAISDEFGIKLFCLPSLEEVWSTPLPALVTSLAARPHSPHLDLGVATQQGVVLIRPRLSPYWQRRLLQKR